MVTNAELEKFLKENPPHNQFVPYCHVSHEADTLTVYFEGDADYSKRLNDHVTLYFSLETDEIVGCHVKGISGLLEDLPNYIKVNHGNYELAIIFLAFRGSADSDEERKKMNDLARTAAEKGLVLQPS